MPNSPLVVLAAGGTGGHVFPAEALAVELGCRGCRMALITDRRGGAFGGRLGKIDTYRVRAGGIAGKGAWDKIKSVIEILIGTLQAHRILKRLKPDVVVGFGGYASVPPMLAANWLPAKTALHEQNAVLGRANRLLAGRAQKLATSFEEVAGVPESVAEVVHTGMPVRTAVTNLRNIDYPVATGDGGLTLVVFGGSQGASVFSRIVPDALSRLDENLRARIKVVQQCRPDERSALENTYQKMNMDAEVAAFFDDMPARIAAAHLVICRSGASTIAELTTIGRPSILVPYPFSADDHQTNNAHAVDAAGGGWLMPETTFTAQALAERLGALFGAPRILENAAAAAKVFGRPDAAERLADMVCGLLPDGGANLIANPAMEVAQ
ncbi:MAG: undecaprenyldiphospho-muramoylpentapeptide beta-N-acetylglucosaminyltransferase [Rhodospirillales bacterium]|nr:undecaprenyldiphospho-muramoylpentapeptide beta-N-acetylglucosaminyltransferase [Rhodospirillales bacterium]